MRRTSTRVERGWWQVASGVLGAVFLFGNTMACGGADDGETLPFVVVTFNTGTSEGLSHDSPPDDGYTSQHAAYSDQYYGDGLAWMSAVEATGAFFDAVQPDVVGFQEIFYSEECASIPTEARVDFICEDWSAGDPTVAQLVLGDGYQVMCNPGKPDKCAAVKKSFGSFRGCSSDFCLEGMDGYPVQDCGSGARVGRALIDLAGGGTLTLVNYHGSSGLTADEEQCRVAQVDQVFVDLGDGEPGASGAQNLVIGDLNTDPGRMALYDPSAARWLDFVAADPGDAPFHFITDVGEDAPASYQDALSIDHVMGDSAEGSCWVAGLTEGHPAVIDAVYFDHKPIVCPAELPIP